MRENVNKRKEGIVMKIDPRALNEVIEADKRALCSVITPSTFDAKSYYQNPDEVTEDRENEAQEELLKSTDKHKTQK